MQLNSSIPPRPLSGVRPIPLVVIVDRELHCQKSSLDEFCREYDVTPQHVARVLDQDTRDERVMSALADALGVTTESLLRRV